MEKNTIKTMVGKKFLDNLSRLTDNNNHGEVYCQIAGWGYENCEEFDDQMAFRMFERIFEDFEMYHDKVDNFPFGELRYSVGKEMEERIVRVFGQETMDIINSAC